MKCAVEMGSGAMIYVPFHKDWFRHSKVGRGDLQTLLLFFFFKISKVG
jgi:hypothetical protein